MTTNKTQEEKPAGLPTQEGASGAGLTAGQGKWRMEAARTTGLGAQSHALLKRAEELEWQGRLQGVRSRLRWGTEKALNEKGEPKPVTEARLQAAGIESEAFNQALGECVERLAALLNEAAP